MKPPNSLFKPFCCSLIGLMQEIKYSNSSNSLCNCSKEKANPFINPCDNSYILKGLKQKVPELEINSLSFRLKGSNVKLAEVEIEKNSFKNIDEKELKKNFEVNNNLPDDLRENFNKLKKEIDKIKKDVLTKNE